MKMPRFFRAAALLLPLIAAAHARPVVQDPVAVEERAEELAFGERIFDNSCRMCHEPELVLQQRLTPRQWDAEIEKMIGWGAAVAPEEIPWLRAYLTTNFSPSNPHQPSQLDQPMSKPASVVHSVDPRVMGNGDVARGQSLFLEHCGTCHGSSGQGGEPGQNLIAQPVLSQASDFQAVIAQGRHKMPAFDEVLKPEQTEDIRSWLLTLEYQPQ